MSEQLLCWRCRKALLYCKCKPMKTRTTTSRKRTEKPSQTKMKIKVTFRIVEYHTIERTVSAKEFAFHQGRGDTASWLDEKFCDDPMPDSSINTECVEIDNWEVLSADARLKR